MLKESLPNALENVLSGTIILLSTLSCRSFAFMYTQTFLIASVRVKALLLQIDDSSGDSLIICEVVSGNEMRRGVNISFEVWHWHRLRQLMILSLKREEVMNESLGLIATILPTSLNFQAEGREEQ